jgi:thiamine transporter
LERQKNMKRETTRTLVECALAIAMSTALSMFIIIQMPQGGAVTCASMAPLVVISFRHGLKWGALTAFAYSLLQMMIQFYAPPAGTLLAFAAVVLLDYVLAFTVIGTAVVFGRPFKNRTASVAFGAVVVSLFRLLCSFLSGILIWFLCAGGNARLALFPHL